MPVLRIIDANANRAREALRVMEEAARFILDDASLTEELKRLRHALAKSLARLDAVELHRNTPGDVGTVISTDSEMSRSSVADAVIAAGKRLGESLRALEEYGKIIDVVFAAEVERHRYAAYELEQRLHRALGCGRTVAWSVTVLLSESVCGGRDWFEVASAIADAEPDCVQLREKGLADAALLKRARRLRERLNATTSLVINDRPDVALLAGADGVHLGQSDLPCREVRAMVGRRLLIGVSTSRLVEARDALRDGADYCGVGPMFVSSTKPKSNLAGPAYLREYLAWGRLPHVAISGITPENVGQLVALGCRGVAVSRAVCAAADPAAVVRELREAIAAVPGLTPTP